MLRRHLWRWLAVAMLASITTVAAAPAGASAATAAAVPIIDCQVTHRHLASCARTAGPSYVGWVYLNLNYCAPGMMCAAVYRDSTQAWSWTGTAWRQTTIRQGWVYVYPYTGSWRWAWTQSTGWVAIYGGRFEIRAY